MQAVATWRFEPPVKEGKAVVTRAEVPFKFKLSERDRLNTPTAVKELAP